MEGNATHKLRRTGRVRISVTKSHRTSAIQKVLRRRSPGPAVPDHERVRSLQHQLLHRNFRVARDNKAQITAMIQKRTMIRGSGQPLSSKW